MQLRQTKIKDGKFYLQEDKKIPGKSQAGRTERGPFHDSWEYHPAAMKCSRVEDKTRRSASGNLTGILKCQDKTGMAIEGEIH